MIVYCSRTRRDVLRPFLYDYVFSTSVVFSSSLHSHHVLYSFLCEKQALRYQCSLINGGRYAKYSMKRWKYSL